MFVENTLDNAFTIRRGVCKVRITPGINNLPDYEWVEAAIERQPHLRYVPKYKLNKNGTIKKTRKKKKKDDSHQQK